MSSGRMSGEGRDTDGNTGAFLETTCEGHSDHLGGGKPPSSKMPTLLHDRPVAGPQRPPQEYRDVQRGADKKIRRLAEAEVRDSAEMAFEVYRKQIQSVPRFKYLGRILAEGDDNWPEVAGIWKRPGRVGGGYRGS